MGACMPGTYLAYGLRNKRGHSDEGDSRPWNLCWGLWHVVHSPGLLGGPKTTEHHHSARKQR